MACRKWRELSTADFGALPKEQTLVVLPIGRQNNMVHICLWRPIAWLSKRSWMM